MAFQEPAYSASCLVPHLTVAEGTARLSPAGTYPVNRSPGKQGLCAIVPLQPDLMSSVQARTTVTTQPQLSIEHSRLLSWKPGRPALRVHNTMLHCTPCRHANQLLSF